MPAYATVVFDISALTTIRNAVVEAYPKESFGMLYGEMKNRRFYIKHAQVMQKVDRTSNSVTPNIKAKKRIDFLMDLDKMEALGSYHSHPKTYYPYLSKTDVEEWDLFDEIIQAIVSVSPTRLNRKKWYKHDKNTFATRIVSDKRLNLKVRCYTRHIRSPCGYKMLTIGKRKTIE